MSVLIKGMKMSKSCGMCRFDDYGYCTMAKRYSGGSTTYGKASFCPLIELPEKHGRLIDADKLMRDINKYHLSDGKFQHWVEVQPTVIEAEGE